VSTWRVGNRLEVVIVGYGTRHEQIVESLEPLAVDVVEMNLEDAFIEYTRGQRRGLPLLSVEKQREEHVSA
jgi:ABC-2 type transport system ATP-binding protein